MSDQRNPSSRRGESRPPHRDQALVLTYQALASRPAGVTDSRRRGTGSRRSQGAIHECQYYGVPVNEKGQPDYQAHYDSSSKSGKRQQELDYV